MKLKHLLLTALIVLVGGGTSWAAVTDYLTGWTEVTSLPTNNDELSRYYYVFVEGDMMIAQGKATAPDAQGNQLTAIYKTPADPKADNTLVWTLNYDANFLYGIRSLSKQDLYMQSRENWPWRLQCAWEANQSNWTRMDFAYSNGTWTIQNKGHRKSDTDYGTNYWGSWGEGSDRYTNGYCLAGNKSGNYIGKFKIYSLLRCMYTPLAPNKNMTDFINNPSFNSGNTNGWTINNDGGKSIAYHGSSDFDGKFAEVYELQNNKSTYIQQTIENLPAGLYKVTCRSIARNVTSAQLYANANNTDMLITNTINDYEVYEKLNETGSITLGARVTGSGIGASWFAVDAFTLTYVADDFEEVVLTTGLLYHKELEEAQNTAKETFEANKTVANYQVLVAAAAAAKAEKEYEEAQVARTTAALANGTIATDVIDGWRCTNAQAFRVNTWSGEGATDGSDMVTPFIENWVRAGEGLLGNGEISYLMVGLEPGAQYSFSALGRAIIENDKEATLTGITMFANEASINLTEQGTATSDDKNSLVYGTFTLTGTVNENGVLAIGFKITDTNCNWLSFKNVKFGELPTEAEKTTLQNAIAAQADKIIGFEEGEYAPYKNVDAVKALAAAKAIDIDHAMKVEIVNATNALAAATWTANTEDMDAFYDGTFDTYATTYRVDSYGLKGWTTADVNNMRKITEDFAGEGKGLYIWPTTIKYGEVAGYTMPLAANTVYRFEMSYGGWNNTVGGDGPTISLLNGETGIAAQTIGGAPKFDAGVATIVKYFKTAEAGDYVFTYVAPNGTNTVVGNFSLVKMMEVERTTVAGKYGTICLPFDFSADRAEIYSVESINGVTLVLTTTEDYKGAAGTPYVYMATEDAPSFTAVEETQCVNEPNNTGLLTGSFQAESQGLLQVPAGSYVLQTQNNLQAFYLVDGTQGNIYCGTYKCYLNAQVGNARPAFYFGGNEETAIDALGSIMSGKAQIYDLNGRKLDRLQKGINIVGGVKVIVK